MCVYVGLCGWIIGVVVLWWRFVVGVLRLVMVMLVLCVGVVVSCGYLVWWWVCWFC